MQRWTTTLTAALILTAAGASSAQVHYDEAIHGPFSTDNLNPTDLGLFAPGSNVVAGTVAGAFGVGNVDVFTFEIAPGAALTSLFVTSYLSNDAVVFMAIAAGTSFPYNPAQLPGGDQDAYLGATHFGMLEALNGSDILPGLGTGANVGGAGSGFTPPLGPGVYTVYIQQASPAETSYALEFVVVPAPAGGAALAFGATLLARRRR